MAIVTRYIDQLYGNALDVAPHGITRSANINGVLMVSFDGGAFAPPVLGNSAQLSGLMFGPNLTDASATVNPGLDFASAYLMPAGTQTANRSITLGTDGSLQAGLIVTVFRYDLSAHTLAIINGGVGGTTLITFAASPPKPQACSFTFDGTNYGDASFYFLSS